MSWVITGSEKTPVDPQFTSVSLLLHGNGANGSTTITDSSRFANTVTAVGNAQISTAIADPFGNSSSGVLALDGTGDYLTTTSNTAFRFGTGAFTIESWVRFGLTIDSYGRIVQCGNFNTGGDWQLLRNVNPNPANPAQVRFDISGSNLINSSILVPQNTWAHVAVTKSADTVQMFINGTLAGTATSTVNLSQSVITVGASTTGTESHNGYIDDLRITKGVARYTANFTPPTAPFPDI